MAQKVTKNAPKGCFRLLSLSYSSNPFLTFHGYSSKKYCLQDQIIYLRSDWPIFGLPLTQKFMKIAYEFGIQSLEYKFFYQSTSKLEQILLAVKANFWPAFSRQKAYEKATKVDRGRFRRNSPVTMHMK